MNNLTKDAFADMRLMLLCSIFFIVIELKIVLKLFINRVHDNQKIIQFLMQINVYFALAYYELYFLAVND